MLRSYFKIALRNLRKHKGYMFINVAGLAVGIAVCLLIVLFVRHELSYDRFHEKADRLYRVLLADRSGGGAVVSDYIPEPVAPAMKAALPGVENAVRISGPYGEVLVTVNGRRSYEDRYLEADPAFFDLFSYEPVAGDLHTALAEPGSVVLTASAARAYFGDTAAVGQVLTISAREEASYTVKAVIEDVPSTSHLQFDMVAYRAERDQPRWNFYSAVSYVLLREDTDLAALEAMLPGFVEKNAYYEHPREDLPSVLLQPATTIHLYPEWGRAHTVMGPVQYLYLFAGVALLILVIACVNFMNLATARSANRAREVGVRKSVGAGRGQLVAQFLGESMLMSGLALVLALVLVEALLPAFNALLGQPLTLSYRSEPILLLIMAGIALGAGLLSGTYPALFLSSFRPVRVLKGQLTENRAGAGFRKALVVFQFGASVMLITATAVIYQQMNFIRTARLNAHDSQVLVVQQGEFLGDRFEAFKQALEARPHIEVAAAGKVPGSIDGTANFGDDTGAIRQVDYMNIGYDYLHVLGIDVVAGRDFVPSDFNGVTGLIVGSTREEDRRPILLNETAVRELGLDDPVGAFVEAVNGTVVGVVRDFHMRPMHEVINPLVMQLDPDATYTVLVRLEAGHLAAGLDEVRRTWQQFVPENPLLYRFLDDELDDAYRSELRLGNLFGAFAALAVFIACLGLFGLAAFTAEQRTKEIGVRKVLGASVPNLVVLLSKDFLVLVLIAFVLAAPVAYFGMERWLADFAYRVEPQAGLFVATGVLALLIALVTVSYQAIKVALADPVTSLRYE